MVEVFCGDIEGLIEELMSRWRKSPFWERESCFQLIHYIKNNILKDSCPGQKLSKPGQEVELWRSYISGAILLGIAPCTVMVWLGSYLARGNDGLTLVMVAINSLSMLVLYAPLDGFRLGVNAMPIPWQTW